MTTAQNSAELHSPKFAVRRISRLGIDLATSCLSESSSWEAGLGQTPPLRYGGEEPLGLEKPVHISGRINAGEGFEREIGRGLKFLVEGEVPDGSYK